MAAIVQAGRDRLRPILMTTLTASLGLLPLAAGDAALAVGGGGPSYAPMARTIMGGLMAGAVMSLFVVPAFYVWIDNGAERVKRFMRRTRVVEAPPRARRGRLLPQQDLEEVPGVFGHHVGQPGGGHALRAVREHVAFGNRAGFRNRHGFEFTEIGGGGAQPLGALRDFLRDAGALLQQVARLDDVAHEGHAGREVAVVFGGFTARHGDARRGHQIGARQAQAQHFGTGDGREIDGAP